MASHESTIGHPSPSTMRAAVYRRPRELEIQEWPVPEVGPGDALVAVSHCGVCGTDLHLVLEGMGLPDTIPGHEWSGRVVAVGAEVEGVAPGDLVVGGPSARCGVCDYCRSGRPSLCAGRQALDRSFQGAFAEYVRVPAGDLLAVPDGLSLREAALTEPLSVALHAIDLSGLSAGSRARSALVTGAGPIGLLAIAALRAAGVDDVRVSEPAARRREHAGKVGATRLLEPGDLETPPMPFTIVDDPVDVVLECSGNPAAMESGLGQLRPAGRLVMVGTGMRRPRYDHNRILMNELVVTGSYCHGAQGYERAIELLASGALPTDALIEPGDVALPELFPALERLEAGELAGKVMIVPGETS
jgi:2-desacetyl-2-hydroxyethyl bacteriochlorophyllide A dehydrogenase